MAVTKEDMDAAIAAEIAAVREELGRQWGAALGAAADENRKLADALIEAKDEIKKLESDRLQRKKKSLIDPRDLKPVQLPKELTTASFSDWQYKTSEYMAEQHENYAKVLAWAEKQTDEIDDGRVDIKRRVQEMRDAGFPLSPDIEYQDMNGSIYRYLLHVVQENTEAHEIVKSIGRN